MDNGTNSTTNSTTASPHLYQVVVGCVTFFLVLPFVLIPLTRYPLGSTGAVLVGAFLMVATTVIDQSYVYEVIGDPNNLKTIFLLWGMMIICSYFERERLIDLLLNKFFPPGLGFHWWLLRLCAMDAIVAALFTNDVACVILTPLMINRWSEQKRDKHELNTLLLALATQANIGSTLTIFGNPQMALMASKSNAFVDHHSRLELQTCVKYLWLPTFVVWALNYFFLLCHYRFTRGKTNRTDAEKTDSEMGVAEDAQSQEEPPLTITVHTSERSQSIQCFQLKKWDRSSEHILPSAMRTPPLRIDRSGSVTTLSRADEDTKDDDDDTSFQESESRLFKVILCTVLVVVIALLFASNDKVYFDIGLVPVGAAIILLFIDTLRNHQPPIVVLARIDWNVLVLFFGLFVWLAGLNSTNIPHRIWIALDLESVSLTSIPSLLLFSAFALIGSNVFSNVPLTLLVLDQIPRTGDHLSMVLYLAFVTTIAGNLTLFGSVANLIVAQKALASPLKHRFGFLTYLKYGFITTIILMFVGVFILYGLIQVIH